MHSLHFTQSLQHILQSLASLKAKREEVLSDRVEIPCDSYPHLFSDLFWDSIDPELSHFLSTLEDLNIMNDTFPHLNPSLHLCRLFDSLSSLFFKFNLLSLFLFLQVLNEVSLCLINKFLMSSFF
jgi:hypothetical protein